MCGQWIQMRPAVVEECQVLALVSDRQWIMLYRRTRVLYMSIFASGPRCSADRKTDEGQRHVMWPTGKKVSGTKLHILVDVFNYRLHIVYADTLLSHPSSPSHISLFVIEATLLHNYWVLPGQLLANDLQESDSEQSQSTTRSWYTKSKYTHTHTQLQKSRRVAIQGKTVIYKGWIIICVRMRVHECVFVCTATQKTMLLKNKDFAAH